MKHTKGPWTIQDQQKELDLFRIMKPDQNEGLAIVNSRADARLIAAAPELLESAKAFMRLVYNDIGLTREQMKLLQTSGLHAAIAKAEGGTK
jgi:DNA polymerase III psi subunit